jgi:hypothetical protein
MMMEGYEEIGFLANVDEESKSINQLYFLKDIINCLIFRKETIIGL